MLPAHHDPIKKKKKEMKCEPIIKTGVYEMGTILESERFQASLDTFQAFGDMCRNQLNSDELSRKYFIFIHNTIFTHFFTWKCIIFKILIMRMDCIHYDENA